ncbi:MAG: hypothetical protein VX739_05415, partial [Planctomycetota bacterium]|nr:hypothetical protein [Planctomycetota bacterium]
CGSHLRKWANAPEQEQKSGTAEGWNSSPVSGGLRCPPHKTWNHQGNPKSDGKCHPEVHQFKVAGAAERASPASSE